MTIVYCKKCDARYEKSGELPMLCPSCGKIASWHLMTLTPSTSPTVPWVLTPDDKDLLRDLHVRS